MMATSRRRSREESDLGDDEIEVTATPATIRASSPADRPGKRQRTARIANDIEVEEIDIDEGIDAATNDDGDEDADSDIEATQRENAELQQRIRTRETRERQANESDVIKSIELFNFMCHKRLEIQFGDQINFIIGHNGSGKSAILTALTICLGGKATATNRGSSLKNLIKEGENTAAIIIKILNGGKYAYNPETYGNVIAIERRFSRDGGSGYKIKNEQGVTISTKREELQEILDHIQLQVDNPLTVLTQDTARQFLGNSSAGDKYKLFMRGVQLSQLDADYTIVEEQLMTTEGILATKKEAYDDLKQKENDWKTKRDIFKRSAEIEKKAKMLQNHFVWSQVKTQEELVAHNEQEMKKSEDRIAKAREKKAAEEAQLDEADLKVQNSNDAKEALEAQRTRLKDELQAAKDKFNASKEALNQIKIDKETIQESVQKIESDIKDQYKNIEEERKRNDSDSERNQLEADLATKEQEVQDRRQRYIQLDQDAKAKFAQVQAEEQKISVVKQEREDIRGQLTETIQRLTKLNATKAERLMVFNDKMPSAIKEIQRNKARFREMPIGPLGLYVKVLPGKAHDWAKICETIFGRNLNGFLVTNYEDQVTLRQILSSQQCDVPVIISKKDLFDYSAGEPDPSFDTVLRILEISDEQVKRQLIVQNHIEGTILIADRARADHVMNERPARVIACYALNPTKEGAGYRLAASSSGSNIAPVYPYKGALRLTALSIEEQMKEVQAEKMAFDKKVSDLGDEINRLERSVRALRAELKTANANSHSANTAYQRASTEVDALRAQLDALQPADTTKIDVYEAAIAEYQEEKTILLKQYAVLASQQMELVKEHEAIDKEYKERGNAIKQHEQHIKAAYDEFEAATTARIAITSRIDYWKHKIEEIQKEYELASSRTEEERAKLEQTIEGASHYCPERVPNEEIIYTADQIKRRIEVLKAQILQMQQDAGMTEDEANAKYMEVHNQCKQAREDLSDIEDEHQRLRESYRTRRQRFFQFRKNIVIKAKTNFSHLLSRRGYYGKLKFDHQKQEIRIIVNPAGDSGGSRKDPKSLSGGEKSFAQICLLLSVWEAMGSPIRALDEFDVFMDAVNRKTSMALMIEAARFSVGKQFILITPQDMGNVAMGPDIRVHRMRDPERGQGVINST